MEFNVDEFVAQPSLDKLHPLTKEHLVVIVDHFGIAVPKQAKKKVIKSELVTALTDKGVLPCDTDVATVSFPSRKENAGYNSV